MEEYIINQLYLKLDSILSNLKEEKIDYAIEEIEKSKEEITKYINNKEEK